MYTTSKYIKLVQVENMRGLSDHSIGSVVTSDLPTFGYVVQVGTSILEFDELNDFLHNYVPLDQLYYNELNERAQRFMTITKQSERLFKDCETSSPTSDIPVQNSNVSWKASGIKHQPKWLKFKRQFQNMTNILTTVLKRFSSFAKSGDS